MADTTPRLPDTVDATDYAPYSFLAVMALVVAMLFAVVLLLLGVSAWLAGQPLFEPVLLGVPFVALVIAFAARRQIINSEGTRVGMPLVNYAWWIAVIGGLGYLAYIAAIDFAIRQDAVDAFNHWSVFVVNANPTDPKNVDLNTAFHGTLGPDKQPSILPNDTAKIATLYGPGLMAFRQSDLVRLAYRSGGQLTFEVMGLENWKNEKNGALDCKLTVKVLSPEGEHTMSVGMQRMTLKTRSEPVWQIIPPQNEGAEFFHSGSARLTAYGERLHDAEVSGRQLVDPYFLSAVGLRDYKTMVFEVFGKPLPDPKVAIPALHDAAVQAALPRMAAFGGMAWFVPDPADGFADLARKHFVPLDRGDSVREEEQRKQFARAWRSGILASPGHILQRTTDVNSILVPGEKAWEIRVPIEIKASTGDRSASAARGVVVCVVDDPAFLQELRDLKANPGPLGDGKHRLTEPKPVPWRLVRIESDMKVQMPSRTPPGGE